VVEAGRRRRNQPAPPHAVFEALTRPDLDSDRPWLVLLDDEIPPGILETVAPGLVVWSSLWIRRPDARVRFELPPDCGDGTDPCWTLTVEAPLPADALLGHIRKRINELINRDMRRSFGQ
jgi:hypothetical protein